MNHQTIIIYLPQTDPARKDVKEHVQPFEPVQPEQLELPRVLLTIHRIQQSKFHEQSFEPDESQQLNILIFQRRKSSNWSKEMILNAFTFIAFFIEIF